MPVTSKPQNPFNNVTPNMLTEGNYQDPFELAQTMQSKAGLPTEVLDTIHTHCHDIMKDSWMGFIDSFQMNIGFDTDYIQFVETTTPDHVIDDDGAVTRVGNDFTIDWTAVQGYEAGEDAWFYRKDFTIIVADDAGVRENGVITAVNKATNTFTAVSRNGANWTVDTSNISVVVIGGDFDKGSCSPEGLLELRKKNTQILKLITIKDSIEATGGTRYAYCVGGSGENAEYAWYDENNMFLRKRLNKMLSKTLLTEIESVDQSGAYLEGKYGTKGMFQNIEENGIVHTDYITDIAGLEAITDCWDELGFNGDKDFIAHVDNTQFRHLEKLAVLCVKEYGIDVQLDLCCNGFDLTKVGFTVLQKDGYRIFFSKWGLTEGNSPLGKGRIKDVMPKGIIMPMGNVTTTIMGEKKQVPYVFKAYQDKGKMSGGKKAGMIRTYFTGGFNGDGDCEYAKTSKSTTVGIALPCPEALVLIK